MIRIARGVVPGLPHHVTQRGNRRERIFFEEGDHALLATGSGNPVTASASNSAKSEYR
jgi:REP element-mobilizing transposase RayT